MFASSCNRVRREYTTALVAHLELAQGSVEDRLAGVDFATKAIVHPVAETAFLVPEEYLATGETRKTR
jgi:hypothetical protein